MTDKNMNDAYATLKLTPVESDDELRERYARLERETRARWSEEDQQRQNEIDARMIKNVD